MQTIIHDLKTEHPVATAVATLLQVANVSGTAEDTINGTLVVAVRGDTVSSLLRQYDLRSIGR